MTSPEEELIIAASKRETQKVKALLKAGANIHYKDDDPLQQACWAGHTEVVKILLENGANVHAEENEALKHAIEQNQYPFSSTHTEIIKILLKAYKPPELRKLLEEKDNPQDLIKTELRRQTNLVAVRKIRENEQEIEP